MTQNLQKMAIFVRYAVALEILTFSPLQQRWRGYSNGAVRGWFGEQVGACMGR